MSTNLLQRTHFSTGRADEYFNVRELTAQTGQDETAFASVVLKELVDNGLDAAETAGVAPEIEIAVEVGDDTIRICVSDNGPGLTPAVLERILDFDTRTSDKSRYRSPTRGAQGNALKTVIGIPTALGGDDPVIIEACGRRHTIRPRLDTAGNVDPGHEVSSSTRTIGTRVEVTLLATEQEFNPDRWARAFALANPHTSVRITIRNKAIMHAQSEMPDCDDSYQRSVDFPGTWKKWRPSDPTSPHWYSPSELTSLVDAERAHGRMGGADGKLLRDFVREFRGLTGTAKAMQVCAALPHVKRLDDLDGNVGALLTAMQDVSTPPKPGVLGVIGKAHLEGSIDRWYGIRRSWYDKKTVLDGNIPIVIESFVAETEVPGGLTTVVNFSPTFSDPLARSILDADKEAGYGAAGLLQACSVMPRLAMPDNPTYTAFLHISSPSLTFLDRGKSQLAPSQALVDAATSAIWKTAKTAWGDAERRRKDAAKAERHHDAAIREWNRKFPETTVKDAAFTVMKQAWSQATEFGEWPASARTVFYQARPLMQKYTNKNISDVYFTQSLLPEYERLMGKLRGVYYEPRGTLYEPHTGRAVPLGTQEVEGYYLPALSYDKVLYIEKQGLWPVLEQAKLGERYDMAVIAGAGFAPVAARELLAEIAPNCTIFVVHDADPSGYNIGLTLGEPTERMPDHQLDVIDIGLTLGEAEELGLEPETFTRKADLPARLLPNLDELEERLWQADKSATSRFPVTCHRVELNALTTPQLVAHITQALDRHGATAKVVPDAVTLTTEADSRIRDHISKRVDELLRELVDVDAIARMIGEEITNEAEPLTPEMVRAEIEPARPIDWRASTDDWAKRAVHEVDDAITRALHKAIDQRNVTD